MSNANGGGITNSLNATLIIDNSTISNNSSTISDVSKGGGGIYNGEGLIKITNSVVNNNFTDGANINAGGGGIYNNSGTTTLTNVIICNNKANSGSGGGIYLDGGTTNLTNVTVVNNRADYNLSSKGSGGGILNRVNSSFKMRNTIVADNVDPSEIAPDFSGILASQGYNLIENTNGTNITGITTGNILGQDPQIAPLANYGGMTRTIALLGTSPAIDAADPNNFPETDQRGISRPQDGDLSGSSLPDIGAYERQVTAFTVTKTADTNDGVCDGDCSLREAIAATDTAPTSDTVITFDPTVFGAIQTITLTLGELAINNLGTLLIDGKTANSLTISGNMNSRVLTNFRRAVVVDSLKITGGNGVGDFNNGFGGGIDNENGTLTLLNSVVSGNTAPSGGGISNNNGTLNIINSDVKTNSTNSNGGGIYNFNPTGKLTVSGSTITGNSSVYNGGGIYNRGTLNLTNSVINGNSSGSGGGVDNRGTLNLTNSVISGNSSNGGGGVINFSGGTAVISNTTVSNNTVQNFGNGGGIDNAGTMTLTGSTINGNTTASYGGGIHTTNTLTVVNSTVNNNTAFTGGGFSSGGTVTLNQVTVSNNKAFNGGGGGVSFASGTFSAANTIVADNTSANSNDGPDFQGVLTSLGYNLIENTNGTTINGTTTGNILGQDPQLLPLADNGGITRTQALGLTSPAVDKGGSSNLTTDQRGQARPYNFPNIPNASGGNGSDIGAFELQLAPTAAAASISGQVLSENRGVANSIVQMTDQNGHIRTARTNSFGYFRFDEVEVGQTYVFNILSKRYQFTPQVVNLNDNLTNLIFYAEQSFQRNAK